MTPQTRFTTEIYSFRSVLYQYAGKLTNDKDEAKDLLSETFLSAFRFIDKFDGVNAKAWLMRIMYNIYVNQFRRKKARPEVVGFNHEIYDTIGEAEPDQGFGDDVSTALSKLTPLTRNVFYLAVMQDYQYDEVAAILKIPIGTVRSRLFKSRKDLKENLFSYYE